jgi:hypothetical protein
MAGFYKEGPGAQGAGYIAANIGALVVLFIWNRLVASGKISDFKSVETKCVMPGPDADMNGRDRRMGKAQACPPTS